MRFQRLYSLIPYKYSWPAETRKRYSFLMKSQWWDYGDLLDLQMKKLSALLRFAYEHVPFYRKAFRERGAEPGDIKTIKDLQSLPVIDKTFVNDHYQEFLPDIDFPDRLKVSTSGSSGEIMHFYWHPRYLHMKSAANHRFEQWTYKGLTGRHFKFAGPIHGSDHGEIFMQKDYKSRSWIFNTQDLSDRVLDNMIHEIQKNRPDTISGYPSIIHLIANQIHEHGHALPGYPAAIMTTSEVVHAGARAKIEDVFRTKVFDWYGMIEGCASAGQCEAGNYHMNMEYNLMEFIEIDGIKRIVGTNLENTAFPLIRYDTGDTAEFAGYHCPCNRGLPVMKLSGGRIKNFIRTPGGNKYLHTQFFNHILDSNVHEYQVIQNSIDSVDVFLVKSSSFKENDLAKIRINLADLLGENMSVRIHMVEHIPRGPRGKYQAVISNMH